VYWLEASCIVTNVAENTTPATVITQGKQDGDDDDRRHHRPWVGFHQPMWSPASIQHGVSPGHACGQ
jgi:hypothetical protein